MEVAAADKLTTMLGERTATFLLFFFSSEAGKDGFQRGDYHDLARLVLVSYVCVCVCEDVCKNTYGT